MESLGNIFGALSDPTRRDILKRLAKGPATVTELAKPYDMSLPAVSRHLKVLLQAGFVRQEREAQRRVCHLRREAFEEAQRWIEEYLHEYDEVQRLFQPACGLGKGKKLGSAA